MKQYFVRTEYYLFVLVSLTLKLEGYLDGLPESLTLTSWTSHALDLPNLHH